MARTYLDNNASAALRPQARAAMTAAMDVIGNPSSVHREGRDAMAVLEGARQGVAALMCCAPDQVIFTSSATEANNMVLLAGWDVVFVSAIEHDSVRAPLQSANCRVVTIPVTAAGNVDVAALADLIAGHDGPAARALISVQMANSETGVIQPIEAVSTIARDAGMALHVDAVQAAGKIALDFGALGAAYATISGHKFGGPKGVGALVTTDKRPGLAHIKGGGQEQRLRAGTQNTISIAGLGAAARAAKDDLQKFAHLAVLRDEMELQLKALTPDLVVIGAEAERLANTSCFAAPGCASETVVIAMDLAGIAVSAGSACASGKVERSHVLDAMGVASGISESTIRVSFGWNSERCDMENLVAAWSKCAMVTGQSLGLAKAANW